MTVAQDEIFGPVGVVIPFEDEDDAIAHRQRHPLRPRGVGVAPGPGRAPSSSPSGVHAGTVSINGGGGGPSLWGPFGGYKQSGIGREYGDYGLLEYTQLKTVPWSAGRP